VRPRPGLLASHAPYASSLDCWGESRGDLAERMSRSDLQTYLVRLLMKQDQMSMAASIESRVPFLDHPLVEAASLLPGSFRLRGLTTKAVLRAALRGLVPGPILHRRKMGFPVPVGRWLRGAHWPLVQELLLSARALERGLFRPDALRLLADQHRAGQADHGDRLWLLMNLEIWHRVCVDGDGAEWLRHAA
jgi:asparagine synthase (glutamine-hydrolysing)